MSRLLLRFVPACRDRAQFRLHQNKSGREKGGRAGVLLWEYRIIHMDSVGCGSDIPWPCFTERWMRGALHMDN